MWRLAIGLALIGTCVATSAGAAPAYHLIPGSVPKDKGPDGNSIFLEAPQGLILIDTGRHPAHSEKLLAYAKARNRPIAAIINTHWHLDHTTGNHDIRRVYPKAEVHATTAIEGALVGFLNANRAQADKMLADPKMPEARRAEILRGRSVTDNPDRLRPTRPVLRSTTMHIAGKRMRLNVAAFAATEADLWLYDPATRTAIVGDLVVDIVPFMDTACPDGWKKALEHIAATPFVTLIPGHGSPMNRAQFQTWKAAFDGFVDCGRSTRPKQDCVAGWQRDAAQFIGAAHREYVAQAAAYYIDTRLRSSPDEQAKFCKPLR